MEEIHEPGSAGGDELSTEEQLLRIKELRFKVQYLERAERLEKESELLSKEQALRVAELGLKVKELEKSEFKKISTYTGLMAIVIALGGVVGQNIWAGIKNDRMLLSADRAKASMDSAKKFVHMADSELVAVNYKLKLAKARYDGLQINIAASNRSIDAANRIFAQLPKKALSNTEKQKITQLFHDSRADLSAQVQLPKDVRPVVISHASDAIAANQNSPVIGQTSNNPSAETIIKPPAQTSVSTDQQNVKSVNKTDVNGRKISAEIYRNLLQHYYQVIITVTGTDPARPLTGNVIFHLPNSFENRNPVVTSVNNQAVYYLKALGAFTLEAEADGGATRLELDLSQIPDAPDKFKKN